MKSLKLTLIFASLALVLAFAVNASAASSVDTQISSSWCGGGQSGSHGPHGYGHGYGR